MESSIKNKGITILNIICPLSGSSNVVLIKRIITKDLIKLYKKQLKIDISSEFVGYKEIGFYFCPDSDLQFFYPLINGSESFYEMMQKFDWYYLDEKEEYNYAAKYIKKNDIILEIGCGKGAFKKIIDTKEYVGIEFSKKAKTMARKKDIYVLNESIQEHSLRNKSKYDVVCSFQVLEHVCNILSFVESCLACLKPGGLLIYSVPSSDSFLSIAENNILNMPPHHVSWWSDKALKKIADIFGMEVLGLEHEQLEDIHLRWYSTEIARNTIKKKIGLKSSLLDNSLTGKIISIASAIIGVLYARKLNNTIIRPLGHSVTIVYRKAILNQ